MKRRLLSLALCLTLAVSVFGPFVPDAVAADMPRTVYTFGSTEGPYRDLAEEAVQRAKAKKKRPISDRDREQKEKAALMKAARERKSEG